MIDLNNDAGTKIPAQKGDKTMGSKPKPTPEKLFLYDRKCPNLFCKGGKQEVLKEYRFRGLHMVQLFCHSCDSRSKLKKGKMKISVRQPYSMSINIL